MRPSWNETWMKVALAIGQRGNCNLGQFGAVIVSSENRIMATGYNGPPGRSKLKCVDCPRHQVDAQVTKPTYSDCFTIHAEANALLFCDRRDAVGGTMYVTGMPCPDCAKLVANAGIARVVYLVDDRAKLRDPDKVHDIFNNSGIEVWPIT